MSHDDKQAILEFVWITQELDNFIFDVCSHFLTLTLRIFSLSAGHPQGHTNTLCFLWNTHSFSFSIHGICLPIVRSIFAIQYVWWVCRSANARLLTVHFWSITLFNILIWDLISPTHSHTLSVPHKYTHTHEASHKILQAVQYLLCIYLACEWVLVVCSFSLIIMFQEQFVKSFYRSNLAVRCHGCAFFLWEFFLVRFVKFTWIDLRIVLHNSSNKADH